MVITAITHLIWHRLRQLNITAWFEWVPSNRNISDLPKKVSTTTLHGREKTTLPRPKGPLSGNKGSSNITRTRQTGPNTE